MSYRDWSERDFRDFNEAEYQQIFDEIPSVADLSEDDIIEAEELFAAGWLTFGVYDYDQLMDFREQFYDLVNYEFSSEDWETYREIYDSI